MAPILLITFFLISTIMIHEYAHYKTGMLLGIMPREVGLGFGPTVYKKKLKKFSFAIKLLPLGGYVSYGENMFEEKDFYDAPSWKRLLISIAGPLSNVAYAFVLLAGLNIFNSVQEHGFSLIRILQGLRQAAPDTINAGVTAVGSTVTHFASIETAQQLIGSFTGIVGAYQQMVSVFLADPKLLVVVFAFVNMALFVFNMLPIPALDGSSVLMCIFEMVFRKRMGYRLMTAINFVGFVVMMVISVVLLFWDVIGDVLMKLAT